MCLPRWSSSALTGALLEGQATSKQETNRIRHCNPNYLQEVLKRIMNLSILSNILNINWSKSLNLDVLGAFYKLEQLQQKKQNVVSTQPHRVWPWGQIQSIHIYHPPTLLHHIKQKKQLLLFLLMPQGHVPEFRSLRWETGTPGSRKMRTHHCLLPPFLPPSFFSFGINL